MSRRNKSKVTSISGRWVDENATDNAGYYSLLLRPGVTVRLINVAKAFEFYRFTKLRYRIMEFGSAGDMVSVGYLPELSTIGSGVATFLAVSELYPGQTRPGFYTCQQAWTNVPKQVLFGKTPTRWWKTSAASSEDLEIVQGEFIGQQSSAAAKSLWIEFEYTCQFAGTDTLNLEPVAQSSTSRLSRIPPDPTPVQVVQDDDDAVLLPPGGSSSAAKVRNLKTK